jgi:gamma-glutamyltranspeptidase/glutathione hydrolase
MLSLRYAAARAKEATSTRPLRTLVFTTVAAIYFVVVHAASIAPVAAENGMVVGAQQLATRVGVAVLKDGGNVLDAAVAVGYAGGAVSGGGG